MRKREVTVLPEALRAWRKERGVSQEALAIEAGISPTLVALIETGKRQPSLANAEAMARVLEVDVRAIAVVHEEAA